jgi:hypothetical protein
MQCAEGVLLLWPYKRLFDNGKFRCIFKAKIIWFSIHTMLDYDHDFQR